MVAKKARGWRSGRREGRSRMVQMTRHLVVSEGKETEPRYLEGVRAALGAANGRKIAIVVKELASIRSTCSTSPSSTAATRQRRSTTCGSCSTRTTSRRPTSTRWNASAPSSPTGRGRSMRCGRTPASSCGRSCTCATRRLRCRRRSARGRCRRRCRRPWASSTARTLADCSAWWTANEPRRCNVRHAWLRTTVVWATSSHLCRTPRLR